MRRTGNLKAGMDAMGHSSVDVAMNYQHPELDIVRDAINSRHILRHTGKRKLTLPSSASSSANISPGGIGYIGRFFIVFFLMIIYYFDVKRVLAFSRLASFHSGRGKFASHLSANINSDLEAEKFAMKYYAVAEIDISDRSWVSAYVKNVTPMVERYGGR